MAAPTLANLKKIEIMVNLATVRAELMQEALASPNLLADIANLERYVAESYSGRSFIEMLQNADDARAQRFCVILIGDFIICANDGIPFTENDFRALCRSASSGKKRGETIGYRGIGFKSVVGIANEVHLFSGNLEATFSRTLTQEALKNQGPTPLVRLPHRLALNNSRMSEEIRNLQNDGYQTVFVLHGVKDNRAADEVKEFETEYLLFLRNIQRVELREEEKIEIFECRRSKKEDYSKISLISSQRNSSWRIYSNAVCDVAISCAGEIPTPLNSENALVHAFLPTLETSGLGIRINADFSTDPSRTRIVMDDTTSECMNAAISCISALYALAVRDSDVNMLACLAPTFDLSTLALQRKSFRTELISKLRLPLQEALKDVALTPNWLDVEDAQKIAASSTSMLVTPHGPTAIAQTNLLRYAGVKNLAFPKLLSCANRSDISEEAVAKIVSHIILDPLQQVPVGDLAKARMWYADEGRISLTALPNNGKLSDGYVKLLKASGIGASDYSRIIRNSDLDESLILEIDPVSTVKKDPAIPKPDDFYSFLAGDDSLGARVNIVGRSIPAWRNAENYVAKLLSSNGFRVDDTSRQNLGYDLVASKEGTQIYIEVKLVDWIGAPFTLTSNEHAVARQHAKDYFIALVLKGADEVLVEFISDPTASLPFERQCRQWTWECSDYKSKNQICVTL